MEGIPILESVPFKPLPFFLKSAPDASPIPLTASPSPFLSSGNTREAFAPLLGHHPTTSPSSKADRMGSVLMEERTLGSKKGKTCSASGTTVNFSPFSGSREGDEVVPFSLQKRRRSRTKVLANDENGEKLPSRKRNSKGRCKEEPRATSIPDSLTSKGMQELDAKTLDLSGFANDLPLEHLMNGYRAFSHKQDNPKMALKDNSLRIHVSSILQNLSQPKPMMKPAENRNPSFGLDMKAPPSPSLNEDKVKTSSSTSNISILESDNAKELSAVQFPLMMHPIIPHEEFLQKLQLPACESIDALIRRGGEPWENKIVSNEKAKRSHMNTNTSLLYGQTGYQDIQGDIFTNSKLNHWYRAEPFKVDHMNEGHLPNNAGLRFPFSLVPESSELKSQVKNEVERTVRFDIDLNKQLPEMEGSEMMIETPDITPESSSLVSCKYANEKESSVSVQSSTDASKEQHCATAFPVDQVTSNTTVASDVILSSRSTDVVALQKGPMVSVNDAVKMQDSYPVPQSEAQKNVVGAPMNGINKFKSETDSERARTNSEATQAVPRSSLTMPSLPSSQKIDGILHDIPYSPRMQVAAQILCEMVTSSSPYYSHDEHKAERFQTDILIRRSGKATERISAHEMGMKSSEEKKSQSKQHHICKNSINAQVKEGKERVMSNNKGSSTIPMKRKTNGIVATHEPWAVTSFKGATRDEKLTTNTVFTSDRMHAPPLKENSVSDLYGKGNGARTDGQSGGTSSKLTAFPCSRKDGKVANAIESSNVIFTAPAKATPLLQRKSEKPCEFKQLLTRGGGGSPKISRPRSSLSKSCFSSQQKNSNGFIIKPGPPVKPQRPVLPYVEEIRHGSK